MPPLATPCPCITSPASLFSRLIAGHLDSNTGACITLSASRPQPRAEHLRAEHLTFLACESPHRNVAGLGDRLQVVEGKIEELQGLPQVDVLISEPMGTLLVNERMLETYLYARDHFLRPGGRMYPVRLLLPHPCQCMFASVFVPHGGLCLHLGVGLGLSMLCLLSSRHAVCRGWSRARC